MPRKPKQGKLFPRCEGPKLYAFKDGVSSIDFKRLISENDPNYTSRGGQAHVFEASDISELFFLVLRNSFLWYALRFSQFSLPPLSTGSMLREQATSRALCNLRTLNYDFSFRAHATF